MKRKQIKIKKLPAYFGSYLTNSSEKDLIIYNKIKERIWWDVNVNVYVGVVLINREYLIKLGSLNEAP